MVLPGGEVAGGPPGAKHSAGVNGSAYELANTVSWMPSSRSRANTTRSATVLTATACGEVICGLAAGSKEFCTVMP